MEELAYINQKAFTKLPKGFAIYTISFNIAKFEGYQHIIELEWRLIQY